MFYRTTGESPYNVMSLRDEEGGGAGSLGGDSGSGSNDANAGGAASFDMSGSVSAVDGSNPGANNTGDDPNANGGDSANNGVGGNGSGTSTGSDNGVIDVGAGGPFGASNMSFSAVDAQVLGAITLGGGVSFGTMGAVAASAATGAAVLGLGVGPVSTAIVDLAHDMSIGLGIAVQSNPSISVFSTFDQAVSAAQTMAANGGVGISAGVATPYGGVLVQVAADQQFGVAWKMAG